MYPLLYGAVVVREGPVNICPADTFAYSATQFGLKESCASAVSG